LKIPAEVKKLKVKCTSCEKKFDVYPENFSNHEIVFCPICGLDHEVIKKTSHVIVESIQFA
jgi:Zn finger protein HypA/HybF involved in hydrogenase expression